MSEATGWGALLRGGHAVRGLVVAGGMAMHAINVFIVITILPSVVKEIGGLDYFAWSTTLYVLASVLAGGFCGRVLPRLGARNLYRLALGCFALGSVACALAPSMAALLAGRFVPGLGAGTLSALSYTMVRALFPERLWPTAISIISASWGIATAGGPAVGGVFAQYGAWRGAFWTVAAVAPGLWLLVERSLPRDLARPPQPRSPMAYLNLSLLCGSVFAVSLASTAHDAALNALGMAAALGGIALFVVRENGDGARLMPHGACRITTPLGATYAGMMMVVVAVNTELFVPYFLQTLHAMAPVNAGYLSALMSAGWTVGSVGVSGVTGRRVGPWMVAGPLLMAASLAVMAGVMPGGGGMAAISALALCLFAQGCGIGICWPHLCAGVYRFAPATERDLAASSMTLVIMLSNALGSALAGLVANSAGLDAGGFAGAAAASAWLFGLYAAAPLLALGAIRRILAIRKA